MKLVGLVESMWRYPVKSMRGEELREAFVGYGGVYGDRLYAFHSSAAPLPVHPFKILNQVFAARSTPEGYRIECES